MIPKDFPKEVHQEEIDAMQDPVATAVIVKWACQGKTKIIPRGQPCKA
ncbi:MAG: hypothetical protein WC626_13880 [Methanoregula sp.]